MSPSAIHRFVNPWKFRRQQRERQLALLRERDGDNCRRCKRPIRFDLVDGHDLGPRVEPIAYRVEGAPELDNLCLTHGRCVTKSGCDTAEVRERARLRNEAALFANARSRRRA